jgi:hypothetical protein
MRKAVEGGDETLLKWLRRDFQDLLTRSGERQLGSSIVITRFASAKQTFELERRHNFRNGALGGESGAAKIADRKGGLVPELAQHKELRGSEAAMATRLCVGLSQSSDNLPETVHDDGGRCVLSGPVSYIGCY